MFSPLYVVEELSARCFAGCKGCFRNFVSGPRDGDMSEETFEAANRDIAPGTMILPQFHGESLLHPKFGVLMDRYKELGLRVSIPVSAGAGIRHIPSLVGEDSPVYILIVSIDGFDPRTHAIRRGSITLSRAEEFARECIRERGTRTNPLIAVRWVESGQSEIEFESYLKRWLFDEGVDFVLRSRMFNYGDDLNSPPLENRGKCHALLEGAPVVLFNGDVLLCERVVDREKYVIGNVLRDDWPTILSRREAMVGNYPQNQPCFRCSAAYLLTGFQGMLWFRHTEDISQSQTIYVHSDHSQTYYSLKRDWGGISWSLKTEREALEQLVPLEATR
jgi:radical SAM protein with 4Fe4S-binding SPASM domain